MKCPKCGYLGFEEVERCRNCGYDFSLVAAAITIPELPIRRPEAADFNPVDELALIDAARLSPPLPWQTMPDGERTFATARAAVEPPAAVVAPPPRAPAAPGPSDLPLFDAGATDDLPLIKKPSPPRPPLAVRRATPEVPRARSEAPRAALLDLSGPAFSMSAPPPGGGLNVGSADWTRAPDHGAAPASVGARIVAVAIDLAILAAIDAIVVHFTMQICGLTWADRHILPKGPLFAFLIVQNGGYLVAFTAGGQTLGKMATGIKVVSTRGSDPIDVPHSLLRTFVWVLLAVPAGLGFLTALFSRERRGLHDQLAGTRVVKGVG